MAEHSIVQSAKQGDPKAIAYLITHTLQKYGITARANRKGLCLRLLLEAEQVPHQATMVKLVTQGMQKLNVESLQMVKVYGRQQGQPTATWRHVIELLPQSRSQQEIEAAPEADPAELNHNGAVGRSALLQSALFQIDDLDPDAMILLPIDPQVQLDDLDPDSLILFPVEPLSVEQPGESEGDWGLESDSPALEPGPVSANPDIRPAPNPELGSDPRPDSNPEPHRAEAVVTEVNALNARSTGAEAMLMEEQPSDSPNGSELEAIRPAKLPQRLTLLLLCLLWFCLLSNTLRLIFSLLKAGSFSLYAGLDLSSTNQPFAGLLLAIVGLAGFIFMPFGRLSLGLTLVILLVLLWWLHRVHASLHNLLGSYPITPGGAVGRLALPIYNIWGTGQIWLTLANRLARLEAQLQLKQLSRVMRRLVGWFYLSLAAIIGLQLGALLLAERFAPFFDSFWFDVLRDLAIWTLSLVWLRLVRITWRALRRLYQTRMAPFLRPRPQPQRQQAVNLSAILLGGGASLLILGLFNCLLGLIAAFVFLSNGLQPESIFPTFYDSESLLILVLVGSFFCLGLGGFLTAHLADRERWLHALGLGAALTLIGLALRHLPLFPALAELPFWFQTASGLLMIPATLAGCGLRQWFRSL